MIVAVPYKITRRTYHYVVIMGVVYTHRLSVGIINYTKMVEAWDEKYETDFQWLRLELEICHLFIVKLYGDWV